MDYCWGVIRDDDFSCLNNKIPKNGIFKYLNKYLNDVALIEKAVLILKSKNFASKSQIGLESSCIKVEGIYLYSFLTRKFLSFASEHNLTVVSTDSDFPFTIRNSILRAKLSKEEFEYLGLVAKRGSFKENKPFNIDLNNLTPNAETRYRSLLGPERTRARNVAIISSKNSSQIANLVEGVIRKVPVNLDISAIASPPLYFFKRAGERQEMDINDAIDPSKKREREEYIPIEGNNKNLKTLTKYKNEMISFFKHENMFKKVYFTIKRNLTSKTFDPSQLVQDLENPKVESLWLSELDSLPPHAKNVENFLIEIGKILLKESAGSGHELRDGTGNFTLKISVDNIIDYDEIIKLIQYSYKESKEVSEGVAFTLVLFGHDPFREDRTGDTLYIACQRVMGDLYLVIIRARP